MAKIEVIADAFKNYFNFQNEFPYCYGYFQAAIHNEQTLVDECIQRMIKKDHPLVLDPNLIVHCKYKPIKTDIHLILDTDLLDLEKK